LVRVVHREDFYHEGRGPELQALHVSRHGALLEAIEYFLPDAVYEPEHLRHLLFVRSQVFMVTPEEVENYGASPVAWDQCGGGAMVTLGRSPWLLSFSQRHLEHCEHFRLMFYDQYVDVICEGVESKRGAYVAGKSNLTR
jgi:hypothetical protein